MALHRISHGFNAILGISALDLVKGLHVVEVTRSFVSVEVDDSPNASPKRAKCRLPSPQNHLHIVSEYRTHTDEPELGLGLLARRLGTAVGE
jgi:hypothetical protein